MYLSSFKLGSLATRRWNLCRVAEGNLQGVPQQERMEKTSILSLGNRSYVSLGSKVGILYIHGALGLVHPL